LSDGAARVGESEPGMSRKHSRARP
jgi:hypothetical protein